MKVLTRVRTENLTVLAKMYTKWFGRGSPSLFSLALFFSQAQMFAIYRTYDVDDSGALDIDETRPGSMYTSDSQKRPYSSAKCLCIELRPKVPVTGA